MHCSLLEKKKKSGKNKLRIKFSGICHLNAWFHHVGPTAYS